MERRYFVESALTASLAGLAFAGTAAAQGTEAAGVGRRLLDRLAASVNAHDVTQFDSIYAPGAHFVNHQALVAAPAAVAPREAVKTYIRQRIAAFPDLALRIEIALEAGDLVAGNLIWSGTQRGTYLGLAPTGRQATWNSTDIFRVRDGLFSDHWGTVDLYGLARQLQG